MMLIRNQASMDTTLSARPVRTRGQSPALILLDNDDEPRPLMSDEAELQEALLRQEELLRHYYRG